MPATSSKDAPIETRIATAPTTRRLRGLPAVARPSAEEADRALVSSFARDVRIACDDLYDEPFSPTARESLTRLLNDAWHIADAANSRLRLA